MFVYVSWTSLNLSFLSDSVPILFYYIHFLAGLETREYGRRDPPYWPRHTLHPQKLALNSATSTGRSVGIIRSPTKATELFVVLIFLDRNFTDKTISSLHIFTCWGMASKRYNCTSSVFTQKTKIFPLYFQKSNCDKALYAPNSQPHLNYRTACSSKHLTSNSLLHFSIKISSCSSLFHWH
jgi:hypothetical protein